MKRFSDRQKSSGGSKVSAHSTGQHAIVSVTPRGSRKRCRFTLPACWLIHPLHWATTDVTRRRRDRRQTGAAFSLVVSLHRGRTFSWPQLMWLHCEPHHYGRRASTLPPRRGASRRTRRTVAWDRPRSSLLVVTIWKNAVTRRLQRNDSNHVSWRQIVFNLVSF